jgi:Uma2 family endonuclease
VTLLGDLLKEMIPAGWHVQSQQPITLAASEPEPDIAVMRGRTTDYPDGHPEAADLLLVAEVAFSTLTLDVSVKGPLYAQAGIPLYLVADLENRKLRLFTEPGPEGYRCESSYGRGEHVSLSFGSLPVDAVLPAN